MVSLAGVEGSLVRVDCLVPIGVGVTGMCWWVGVFGGVAPGGRPGHSSSRSTRPSWVSVQLGHPLVGGAYPLRRPLVGDVWRLLVGRGVIARTLLVRDSSTVPRAGHRTAGLLAGACAAGLDGREPVRWSCNGGGLDSKDVPAGS